MTQTDKLESLSAGLKFFEDQLIKITAFMNIPRAVSQAVAKLPFHILWQITRAEKSKELKPGEALIIRSGDESVLFMVDEQGVLKVYKVVE